MENWTDENDAPVCIDEYPFPTWSDWDASQRDLFLLDFDGNLILQQNISSGLPTNLDSLIFNLLNPGGCTSNDGTEGIELWNECYSIENTTSLDLYANRLTGVIPPEIGNLVNLEGLYLASNQLSGEIPSEIGNLVNLIDLYLSSNQISGEIPESLCNIYPNLSYFQITHNQLCPPYPECIEDYVGYQDTSNCEQVSIIDEILPITYNLYNAYPNPFNPTTTLRYDLPEDSYVNVTVCDMLGREVRTLVNATQEAGYKSVQWNATNSFGKPVSAGVYLYQIQAGEFVQTKKMVLLK